MREREKKVRGFKWEEGCVEGGRGVFKIKEEEEGEGSGVGG